MMKDLESKDILLRKDKENFYLGLHASGYTDSYGQWHNIQSWMSFYDLRDKFDFESARIVVSIEKMCKKFQEKGWQIVIEGKNG